MPAPHLDRGLIAKYDRPGPRYTSYPTALQFHEDFDLEASLAQSTAATGPLSLYFHLPFCESLCWFCACHTVISRRKDRADIYLDALAKEVELTMQHVDRKRPVVQVHLGGGSPNFLTPPQIRRLGDILHGVFTFAPDAECSVELDPRTLTEAKVRAFSDIGFNRASFGIQDSQRDVQEAINRIQPQALNAQTVDWLRSHCFKSVNVDLVYGLPFQTPESFTATLADVKALNPDRVATFNYAHVPWMKPAQKNLERRTVLPGPEIKLSILEKIIETLTDTGYEFIGMDHFAKADDELARAYREGTLHRNFQGYSTRAGSEVLAFGISSISQGVDSYRQNVKALDPYYARLGEGRLPTERGYLLTVEDRLRRDLIMQLMCNFSVDMGKLAERHDIHWREHFSSALEQLDSMQADGLIEWERETLRVTDAGRFLVRNVAMAFDAYTKARPGRHSKTI